MQADYQRALCEHAIDLLQRRAEQDRLTAQGGPEPDENIAADQNGA
jgi:hypothetical protein